MLRSAKLQLFLETTIKRDRLFSSHCNKQPQNYAKYHVQYLELSGKNIIFAAENIKNKECMSTEAMTQKIADYLKTQPVKKAWLFGSFARGEETADSDVDILVEYDENARISLLTISHMIGALERSVGRHVDLIEEGCLLPFAVKSANRDKRLIYERRG